MAVSQLLAKDRVDGGLGQLCNRPSVLAGRDLGQKRQRPHIRDAGNGGGAGIASARRAAKAGASAATPYSDRGRDCGDATIASYPEA